MLTQINICTFQVEPCTMTQQKLCDSFGFFRCFLSKQRKHLKKPFQKKANKVLRYSLFKQRDTETRSYQAVSEISPQSIYTKQFAFYQAGRCLVQTLLFDHPKVSLLGLTEPEGNLLFSLTSLARSTKRETRSNLEILLIGYYAGKAGELLRNYPQKDPGTPVFLLQNRDRVNTSSLCKDLVRVNGVFANRYVRTKPLQGKRIFSQVRNKSCLDTCTSLWGISLKRTFLSNLLYCIATRPNSIKTTTKIQVNKTPNTTDLRSLCSLNTDLFQILLPYSERPFLRKSHIERSQTLCNTQSRDLELTNKLNRDTIEQFLGQLNTGLFERIKATSLVQSIIVKGSIYCPIVRNIQKNSVIGDLNKTEILDKKVFNNFQILEEQRENTYFQESTQTRLLGNKNSFASSFNNPAETNPEPIPELSGSHFSQSRTSSLYQNQTFVRSLNNFLFSQKTECISQKNDKSVVCEQIVCKSLTLSIKPYGHWSRIYLPQIETHQRQLVSTDQFFKKRNGVAFVLLKHCIELGFFGYKDTNLLQAELTNNFKQLLLQRETDVNPVSAELSYTPLKKQRKTKNKPGSIQFVVSPTFCSSVLTHCADTNNLLCSDFPQKLAYTTCHNLVLNAFSRAFHSLGGNRELLDLLADHFIRFEKMRTPIEISRICSLYITI